MVYIYIAGSNGGCSGITLPSLFFFFAQGIDVNQNAEMALTKALG